MIDDLGDLIKLLALSFSIILISTLAALLFGILATGPLYYIGFIGLDVFKATMIVSFVVGMTVGTVTAVLFCFG